MKFMNDFKVVHVFPFVKYEPVQKSLFVFGTLHISLTTFQHVKNLFLFLCKVYLFYFSASVTLNSNLGATIIVYVYDYDLTYTERNALADIYIILCNKICNFNNFSKFYFTTLELLT